MQMPMFTVTTFITTLLLFLLSLFNSSVSINDMIEYLTQHSSTVTHGDMHQCPRLTSSLWGTPEVYIVILPAFGIYSEIIPTFARKRLFPDIKEVWYGQLPVSRS